MGFGIDETTHIIYGRADRDAISEWLRLLAFIRGLPEIWPTRYGGK